MRQCLAVNQLREEERGGGCARCWDGEKEEARKSLAIGGGDGRGGGSCANMAKCGNACSGNGRAGRGGAKAAAAAAGENGDVALVMETAAPVTSYTDLRVRIQFLERAHYRY